MMENRNGHAMAGHQPLQRRLQKGKHLKVKILALALSTLLSLVLGEILLRVTGQDLIFAHALNSFHTGDRELGWIGVPGFTGRFKTREFDAVVRTNEDGFRLDTSQVVTEENCPKIVFLGDSFTWGWGVDNEETFTDRLQRLVGSDYDVANYGVNGYGNVQELILLRRLLRQDIVPQRLFVMMFKNDFIENIDDKNGRQPFFDIEVNHVVLKNYPVARPIGGWLRDVRRKSHVLTCLSYGIDSFQQCRRQNRRDRQNAGISNDLEQVSERAYTVTRHVLEAFKALCLDHDIDLQVVYIPCLDDFPAVTPYRTSVVKMASELDLSCLDLTEDFRATAEACYFPTDGHWNAQGHARAADLLKRHLALTAPGS